MYGSRRICCRRDLQYSGLKTPHLPSLPISTLPSSPLPNFIPPHLCSEGNTTSYTVTISDAAATFKVAAVLTSFLEPFPAEITQQEHQVRL